MFKTPLFRSKLLLISIHVTACARIINITSHSTVVGEPKNSVHVTGCARTSNITYHSTVNRVPENSVENRAQILAMTTKHTQLTFSVENILVQMQTIPDFDPCDGLCMHK